MAKHYWRNWSGSESCHFQSLHQPQSVEALVQSIAEFTANGQPFKCRGSSHSFSSIIARSDAALISLDHLSGIENLDRERRRVRVLAGTKIKDLSRLLWDSGFAIENLGDIEEQSLAGAIATGTHGTGFTFQNLAGFVQELGLISPTRGHWIARRGQDEEFDMAVIGPGIFGVVTHYELSIVPQYYLNLHVYPEKIDLILSNIDSWIRTSRNLEFFWFPLTDKAIVKKTQLGDPSAGKNFKSKMVATYLENAAFGLLAEACNRWPASQHAARALILRLLPRVEKTDRSYKVYATERHVRFQEMEYSVPYSKFPQVFDELRALVSQANIATIFPIEVRFVAGDQLALSPSYGSEPRAYLALHAYHKDPDYERYFRKAEQIFLAAGGRPHWGKMFFLNRADFAEIYPKFLEAKTFRHDLDPDGLMLTERQSKIFGDRDVSRGWQQSS